jgi:hypothetical protein
MEPFMMTYSREDLGTPGPGDELWPKYSLAPLLRSERYFLRQHNEHITDDELRAFTCANKIEAAVAANDFQNARKMAFTALKLGPNCPDAYAGILVYLSDLIDLDTTICGLREIILATRYFYEDVFREGLARFYGQSLTRQYTRALTMLAQNAQLTGRLDVMTYTFEELARLVGRDDTMYRAPLISC